MDLPARARSSPEKFSNPQLLDLAGNAFNGFVCLAVIMTAMATTPWDCLGDTCCVTQAGEGEGEEEGEEESACSSSDLSSICDLT
eukprot:5515821-Heterocapsa_arctica.AAC.1